MRKISLFLIAFLSIQLSFAQEFDVREFAADLTDLSGIRSEKQTVNGEPYAIVKIVTNIRGMNFDANQGNPEVEHKNDGYWLYVAPRERNIKLMASGYMPLDVPMPEPAKSKSVYKMVVATKGGFCITNPSNNKRARMAFSTNILSAFRFSFETLVIQSNVIFSLSIIFYKMAVY
ncbi:MAG: hypothetical protein PHW19_08165 [Salinivirgaceae bacterium]|nr:hypothetical protein [Salinivirgaceae bacterium]